jgi:hypothetical protein
MKQKIWNGKSGPIMKITWGTRYNSSMTGVMESQTLTMKPILTKLELPSGRGYKRLYED